MESITPQALVEIHKYIRLRDPHVDPSVSTQFSRVWFCPFMVPYLELFYAAYPLPSRVVRHKPARCAGKLTVKWCQSGTHPSGILHIGEEARAHTNVALFLAHEMRVPSIHFGPHDRWTKLFAYYPFAEAEDEKIHYRGWSPAWVGLFFHNDTPIPWEELEKE